jgi:hemin uptake protein HemP
MSNIITIDTKTLFTNNEKTIQISHNGKVYVLRITKEDKLILTK